MTADRYIEILKYDRWYLFHTIPMDIKTEVIELMDECTFKPYTYIWEGSWFKKVLRNSN